MIINTNIGPLRTWATAADRRWLVVDERGRFISQREQAHMALIRVEQVQGGIRLNLRDTSIDSLIPDTNAPELRVSIWGDSVRALLAGSTAGEWLSAHSRLDNPVPMNRFRPNLVVSGCDRFAEDGWRRIHIGEVEFDVAKPCSRCAIPSIDQATPNGMGR